MNFANSRLVDTQGDGKVYYEEERDKRALFSNAWWCKATAGEIREAAECKRDCTVPNKKPADLAPTRHGFNCHEVSWC